MANYSYETLLVDKNDGILTITSVHPTNVYVQAGAFGEHRFTSIRYQSMAGGRRHDVFASTNWQESDRLMSAVMTAVGSKTDPLTIDGVGTFNGVMLGDLAAPRIEASFTGEALRAWHVEWGAGGGGIVVENSYLDLTNGRFRRGDAEIEVDGRFSLGGPRDDGGEELNTVFSMSSTLPASSTLR